MEHRELAFRCWSLMGSGRGLLARCLTPLSKLQQLAAGGIDVRSFGNRLAKVATDLVAHRNCRIDRRTGASAISADRDQVLVLSISGQKFANGLRRVLLLGQSDFGTEPGVAILDVD